MKQLPESDDSLVIRTDFSDEKLWRKVRDQLAAPVVDGVHRRFDALP